MKLEIARGAFLVVALGITAAAAAAWQQPGPRVLQASDCNAMPCNIPLVRKQAQTEIQPDGNLLLLMFGLKTAMKGEQ
jgi:hypothetical protein